MLCDFCVNNRQVFFLVVSLFSGGTAFAGDELVLQCNGSVKFDQFTIDNGEATPSVMGPLDIDHGVLIKVYTTEGQVRLKILDKTSDSSFTDHYSHWLWYSDAGNITNEELNGFRTGKCDLSFSTFCSNKVTVTEYAYKVTHYDNQNERKYNTRIPKDERDSSPDIYNSFELVLNRLDSSLTYHRIMQSLSYIQDATNLSEINVAEFNFTGVCVKATKKF